MAAGMVAPGLTDEPASSPEIRDAQGQAKTPIHSKVQIPAVALAIVGGALVGLGFLTGDETVRIAGLSVLSSSGLGGVLGFLTPGRAA